MGFMAGKKALIVGVASDRSIATGIAEAFVREGAEVAFTYQNEKLKSQLASGKVDDKELADNFDIENLSKEDLEKVQM